MVHWDNVKGATENVQRNAAVDRQTDCVPEIPNINLKYSMIHTAVSLTLLKVNYLLL